MKKRILRISLALATLLVPTLSFGAMAMSTDTLVSWLAPVWQGMALDSSFELHGNYQDYYLSVWSSGQGKATDSRASMTLDFSAPQGTLRTTFDVLATNNKAYIWVKSIDGTFSNDAGSLTTQMKSKNWIMKLWFFLIRPMANVQ